MEKIVNAEPERLAEVCQHAVPDDLERLVMDCLAKDPEDRPATVFAVLERLEALTGVGQWTEEDAARWWRHAYRETRSA